MTEQFQVWIDLKDRRYAKRLAEFLEVRYGDRMHVMQVGKQGQEPDGKGILLTDQTDVDSGYGRTLFISPEKGVTPYQSGHRIAKKILEARETQELVAIKREEKTGEWISVYSPIGGSGVTTAAMGLAEVISKQKQGRVLFLSLEGFSAWNRYYQYPLSYTISDFFYCFLIEEAEGREKRLNEMVVQQENGVYFLPPCLYADDLTELSETEIAEWMHLLRSSFAYVVVDMGSQLLWPLRQILEQSSRVCYIAERTGSGTVKWQQFEAVGIRIKQKTVWYRQKDKASEGEDCLPEDATLFEESQGKQRFRQGSPYIGWLREVVNTML